MVLDAGRVVVLKTVMYLASFCQTLGLAGRVEIMRFILPCISLGVVKTINVQQKQLLTKRVMKVYLKMVFNIQRNSSSLTYSRYKISTLRVLLKISIK